MSDEISPKKRHRGFVNTRCSSDRQMTAVVHA